VAAEAAIDEVLNRMTGHVPKEEIEVELVEQAKRAIDVAVQVVIERAHGVPSTVRQFLNKDVQARCEVATKEAQTKPSVCDEGLPGGKLLGCIVLETRLSTT